MSHRAAVYCRISRDRVGAGLGVERQRQDCQDLADQLGWTVIAVHTDNDLSAYSGKPRPGYQALLDDLEQGRADAVLTWHTDRLHRSPAELEHYIAVCDQRGAPTQTVKAGPLDLASPSGRLVARQLGAVARYEVEHSVERQKRARLQAATDGKFRGGRRAFGYERDGMTVRADEAAHVARATDRVLAGESLASVADEWNHHGVTTSTGVRWTGMGVRSLLLRARNAGLIEHDGQVVGPAQWPAIVDEATWRAVRAVLTDPARRTTTGPGRRWLGSGLYRCGVCGDDTTMRGASTHGPQRAHVPAYRCRNGPHVVRRASTVDEYVEAVILGRLAEPDATGLTLRDAPEDVQELQLEATEHRERLDELAALYAEGTVTVGQLAEGTRRLRSKLEAVESRIAAARSESALAGIADADDVAAAWRAAPMGRRRGVLDTLMTVTLYKAPRGRRPGGGYFDPDSVSIAWKSTPEL